jgi:hypothetical protein
MNKTVEEQISGLLRSARESIKAAYLKGYAVAKNDDEIRVGDEVYIIGESYKYVVTNINNSGITIMSSKGLFIPIMPKQHLRKTGRHYDISGFLKKLAEERNNE